MAEEKKRESIASTAERQYDYTNCYNRTAIGLVSGMGIKGVSR